MYIEACKSSESDFCFVHYMIFVVGDGDGDGGGLVQDNLEIFM